MGRYLINIKIQKRAVAFYNHLRECDSNPLHNQARNTKLASSVTTHNNHRQAQPNDEKTKGKLFDALERNHPKYRSQLATSLNTEYTVAEYLTTMSDPGLRMPCPGADVMRCRLSLAMENDATDRPAPKTGQTAPNAHKTNWKLSCPS